MSFSAALREFQDLGCEDQTKCALACRVYQDLTADKALTCLERCYDAELDLLYLRGVRQAVPVVFVPALSSQQLDLSAVNKVQTKLSNAEAKSITLAICDSTATVLYFQVMNDFFDKK